VAVSGQRSSAARRTTSAPSCAHGSMTSAFGKVILLGEHAVVYGHPALAGALERGVRATAHRLERGPSTLRIASWGIDLGCDDPHPVAEAARALLDALDSGPLALEAEADVPAAAGLGSSAALAVALTRAISTAANRHLDAAEIERTANVAERCFHANPSGIDVAIAARGGLGLFRRNHGLEPVEAPPLRLLVALSGEARRTADMIARVREAYESRRQWTESRLARLGDAATGGRSALRSGDGAALGTLMSAAHGTLAEIGVSSPALDRLVDAAHRAGALGAKLTGAGGGGAVIALAPEREEQVLEAWRGLDCDCFACSVGTRHRRAPTGGDSA